MTDKLVEQPKPIPNQEVVTPAQPEQTRLFDPSELKTKEVIEAAERVEKLSPVEGARVALEVIAANGKFSQNLENKAQEYIERGKDSPKDMAMGLDLKLEALQIKFIDYRELLGRLGPEESKLLDEELSVLTNEWRETMSERQKIVDSNPELSHNQLHDFAEMFGVSGMTIVKRGGLFTVRGMIENALANPANRESLLDKCRKNGMPENLVEMIDGFYKQDDVKVENERKDVRKAKIKKRTTLIAAGLGAFPLLFAWFAMKAESGRRQQ